MIKYFRSVCFLICLSFYASASSNELRLVGKGVLSYFIWDVYEVSYFKHPTDTMELLKIRYLRDIDRSLSQKGWQESLKHYSGVEDQLKTLVESSVDVKEGDIISIYKRNGKEVVIKKNDTIILDKKDDEKLHSLAHAPWIGKHPVDPDLKKELLD